MEEFDSCDERCFYIIFNFLKCDVFRAVLLHKLLAGRHHSLKIFF